MTESRSTRAMNDNPLQRHGKVSYLEIPATDVARSAAFYQRVFGWSIRGEGDRWSFDDASGDLIGGWVSDRPAADRGGVTAFIYVDRIDAALRAIVDEGGEQLEEPRAEGDLWIAHFRDPAGNVLGVWQHAAP